MGLLKAGFGALGGVLADQWRDYFYCNSLEADVLVAKGQKKEGKRSSNKKGDENVISNGSIIAINDGQCMIIVEGGAVVDICAEPGEFVYDSESEPSIFTGKLGDSIKKSFAQVGRRFTFGGEAGKDQRIYYFNTKEIVGNKYGTPSPVPFRVVDNNIGLDVDISIRCHGEYSYKITNPILFYKNVCGNIDYAYTREELDSQLKAELLNALQPTFARISSMGIRYSTLPAHTIEISDTLNDILSSKWSEIRGIEIAVFAVSSVTAPEEDEKMIKEFQRNAALRNPAMASAHLVGAQAQAMQDAANNQGGMGAVGAFMGMNMVQNIGGNSPQTIYSTANQQSNANAWNCSCGTSNQGNFCSNCGNKKPQNVTDWSCTSCGTANKGKFCSNCGAKKPIGALTYKCDKCGWEADSASTPPRFCPECGDSFDENDVN